MERIFKKGRAYSWDDLKARKIGAPAVLSRDASALFADIEAAVAESNMEMTEVELTVRVKAKGREGE